MTRQEQIMKKVNEVCNDPNNDWKSTWDLCQMMAEWADKTMIEKALKFLLDYDPNDYLEEIADFGVYKLNEEKVKIAFYKAMEQ